MWHLSQYTSIDGLSSCFVICGQLLEHHGCWTGRVLYHRYESPAGAHCVCRVKEFDARPTHEALVTEIEDWMRGALFEQWTKSELWESAAAPESAAPV